MGLNSLFCVIQTEHIKPTKLEKKNSLFEEKMLFPNIIGRKGDHVTLRPVGKEPLNCSGSTIEQFKFLTNS